MLSTRIIPILMAGAFMAAIVGWLMTKPKPAPAPVIEAKDDLPARPKPKPLFSNDKGELMTGTGPADADAPKEFSETPSGLKYRILRKSDQPKPGPNDKVTVHYRGWLDNGQEFDSSYKRGQTISFGLNQVIKGWTEGMQLVGKGGMIELYIPSNLGYGPRGSAGAIPPNADLHFIVELFEIQ